MKSYSNLLGNISKFSIIFMLLFTIAFSADAASKKLKRYDVNKFFKKYNRADQDLDDKYRLLKKHFSPVDRQKWTGLSRNFAEARTIFSESFEEYDDIIESILDLEDEIREYKEEVKDTDREKRDQIEELKKEIRKAKEDRKGRSSYGRDFKGPDLGDYIDYRTELDSSGIEFPYEDSSFVDDATADEKKDWVNAINLLKENEQKYESAKWNFKVAEQAANTPLGRSKRNSAHLSAMTSLYQVFKSRVDSELLKLSVRLSVTKRREIRRMEDIALNAEKTFKVSFDDYAAAKEKMITGAEFSKEKIPLDLKLNVIKWSKVTGQASAELLYLLKQQGIEHIYFPGIFFEDSHKFVVANEVSKSLSNSFSNLPTEFSNKILYPSPELVMDIKLLDGKAQISSKGTFRSNTAIIVGELVKISSYICLNIRAVDLESAKVLESLLFVLGIDPELKNLLQDTAFARLPVAQSMSVRFETFLDDQFNILGDIVKNHDVESNFLTMIDRNAGIPRESKKIGFIMLKHILVKKTKFPIYDYDFLIKALPREQGVSMSMLTKAFPMSHNWIINPEDNKQLVSFLDVASGEEKKIGALRLKKLGGY